MINLALLDPASVPNPPTGRTYSFVGLDGVLRTKYPNGQVVAYQTGISPEEVQDIVGALVQNSTNIAFSYDDTNNTLTATVLVGNISHGSLQNVGTNSHAQIDSHIASQANPHNTTKAQVGLGNCDNTSDLNKPISTAVANALLGKLNSTLLGAANGVCGLDASQKVLLANIPNGIDHAGLANIGANSHAQLDAHLASQANPHNTTKAQVGLGNCDNTSDADKPVSDATQLALDNKSDIGHGHDDATQSASGFMSATDKTKLDGMIADVIKAMTAAVTNTSNTTFQVLNELAIPVIAGKRYTFSMQILFDSAATSTGIGLSIGGTASGNLRAKVEAPISNTAGTANKFSGPISALNGVVTTTAVGAVGTQYVADVTGVFTATTSGLIYPQFRSETNGTQIRVNIDSCCAYKEY